MEILRQVLALLLAGAMAGCASFATGGQFQAGRRALLVNDPETALAYFRTVADQNPNYVYHSMHFREGIWTYVGRTQYETKRYDEARKSLERALAQDRDDHMARLYLGLTLARSGEQARGIKEIQTAMKGINDWLEYMNRTRPFEAYWDPSGQIRGQIAKDLAAPASRDFDEGSLLANAEWLGKTMEEEIDKARDDERRQFQRRDWDRPSGSGGGFGFGIGF
jgi:tetratricopeptide (TPR) repeat protein